MIIRPAGTGDRERIAAELRDRWGSTEMVTRGRRRDAPALPAFVALRGEQMVGLATYAIADRECELVSLDAFSRGEGIGSALLARVTEEASAQGCSRLWLITTNDNLDAVRFYQRRGLRLAAVHRGAVDEARALKPSIPLIGEHGIPLRDEVELELRLA